jgi:hypothetical protein
VEIGRLAEPGHLEIITAAIIAPASVERLMNVANDVDDKAQRQSLIVN